LIDFVSWFLAEREFCTDDLSQLL